MKRGDFWHAEVFGRTDKVIGEHVRYDLLACHGQSAATDLDAFGSTVAGYGDKRHRIMVVGAPGAGRHSRGRGYVYRDLSTRPAFAFDADSTGVALGYMFVSVLGDVDGDGVPDIFASDWSDAGKGPRTGKTYIYSGGTGRRLYTLTGETAGEGFGTTQSAAGDVNGDRRADLIVGSSVAAQSGGRAYLYDGRSGRLLRTYTCRIPGDTFGFDAVGMGTSDNNGQTELLITAGWSGVHGVSLRTSFSHFQWRSEPRPRTHRLAPYRLSQAPQTLSMATYVCPSEAFVRRPPSS